MTHRNLALLLAVGAVVACARHDAPEGAADSAIAAATTQVPVTKTPHVRGIDIGRSADSGNRIVGGVASTFQAMDTITIAVRTEYVAEGADIAIRLRRGTATVDSTAIKSGAPTAEGLAAASTRLAPPKKGWALGKYQIEVLLDGVSQGLQDLEIVK